LAASAGLSKDVYLLQAVAQIAGMAIDLGRLFQGYETSIEILKSKGK
jgi:hypothetical protein